MACKIFAVSALFWKINNAAYVDSRNPRSTLRLVSWLLRELFNPNGIGMFNHTAITRGNVRVFVVVQHETNHGQTEVRPVNDYLCTGGGCQCGKEGLELLLRAVEKH